jgi:hypothetical protein
VAKASRTRKATEDDAWAKRRIRAANQCTTSFYAGWVSLATFFIPLINMVSWFAAAVAVGSGITGLIMLGGLHAFDRECGDERPIDRVAKKMVARAKPMAGTGVGLGLVVLFIRLALAFVVRSR